MGRKRSRNAVRSMGFAVSLLVVAGQASTGGCAAEPGADVAAETADAAVSLPVFDVNEDGILSGTELTACACRDADADGDGIVTAAELGARGGQGVAGDTEAATAIAEERAGDGSKGVAEAAAGAERTAQRPADGPAAQAAAPAPAAAGPPPGRYVCRQYTTTMGYLTLREGGRYAFGGSDGRYRYDDGTGAVEWSGGTLDEWQWSAVYERVVRSADDGRPDEHVIRITSETDGLKIDCFEMADS